jgi:RNA polymerase sigma factor (sigma-70 family)
MIPNPSSLVLQFVRRMVRPSGAVAGSDAELLSRFSVHRDEAAFEALMHRHGPMVQGVCQRILHHTQDVEDAFQATFLVLIRRAGSIRRPERLGNWLYGVALRTAAKMRAGVAKGRAPDRRLKNVPTDDPLSDLVWRDLRPILDEEIQRLPEKYRLAFILCYLEGQTNEQAAQQLCCPKGTVLSRLAWARERLRNRLAQRGLAMSSVGLVTILLQHTASSAMHGALLNVTRRAALANAVGRGLATEVVTPRVAALVEGVLRTMMMTKVKLWAMLVLVVCMAGVGGGLLAFRGRASEPQGTKPNNNAPPPPNADDKAKKEAEIAAKLSALRQAKRDTATKEFDARRQQFLAGRGMLELLGGSSRPLLESELAMADTTAGRCQQYQAHLERMKEIEQTMQERFDAGKISIEDLLCARYWRLEAELWLTQAESK